MKVQFINAEDKKLEIREIGENKLKEVQGMVQGYIEMGLKFPTSQSNISLDLYINEEGLLGDIDYGFAVKRGGDEVYFVGNGVLIGGNEEDGEWVALGDDYFGEEQIRWLSEEEVAGMKRNIPMPQIIPWK